MSELLDDLSTYIDAQTALTKGTDLFGSVLPESPDTAVALIDAPTRPPISTMGSGKPWIEVARVQVLVRAKRADDARAQARIAWNAIGEIDESELGGNRTLRADLLSSPAQIGRDENDRVLYAFEVECWREP